MTHPTNIEGKITLSDGTTTSFSIYPDCGWQQWGNSRDNLCLTTDLLGDLAGATGDHLRDEDDDDE